MGWVRSWKSIARLGFFKHPENCTMELFGGPELGDGWCAARRHNACMEQAVAWNADLILILGADQKYLNNDMIQRFVARYRQGYDVVSAMIPIRGHVANQGSKPFGPICWRAKPDADGNLNMFRGMTHKDTEFVGPEHGEIVQINGCGSGALMFPAEALRSIKAPWFYEDPVMPTFARKACADWPFVMRLQRDAALKIWCDTTIKITHIHPFEIDDTFSERFADWAHGEGDPQCCEVEDPDKGKIRQVRVSPSIPYYDDKFRKRYGLNPYSTPFLPAFFFGCYTREDLKAIQDHTATAVVIWAGTDALNMRKALEGGGKHPFGPNVHHVAISSFIEDDLKALGIPFKSLPLCCVDEAFWKPTPRAGKRGIYAFVPADADEKYGGPFIRELQSLLPEFDWVIHTNRDATPERMREMYEKCFIGVRAVRHDGLSNTKIEMGLMGRITVYRYGDSGMDYSAIDIANTIRASYSWTLNKDTYQYVSEQTRMDITLPEDWKTTAFYDAPQTNGAAPMVTMTPEVAAEPYAPATYFDMRYSQGVLGAGGPNPDSLEVIAICSKIKELIDENGCQTVLDVGCGSMVRWAELPVKPESYLGIDISHKAVNMARKKFRTARFGQYDISKEDLPEQADAVISIDMMQHIKPEDLQAVLDRMMAAAKKLVIIKTSVDIPELHYQFNHDWSAWPGTSQALPLSQYGRLFVFEKVAVNV